MEKSRNLFNEAQKHLVGGVNSPARSYDPYPIFMERARGSKIYDVEGKEYTDYSLAFGPMLLGHAHPDVVKAAKQRIEDGWALGTSTEGEIEFAKRVKKHFDSIDRIRTVNTGTEATMSAVRLARGYTGRDKILKFDGGFHGAHDSVLVKAGSGAATHGAPDSPGVPKDLAQHTIVAQWNDEASVRRAFGKHGDDIACVITEPVFGNYGCIPPKDGFLEFLRDITEDFWSLLIFDEVITGFRVSMGGAQEHYGVTPDLTTLGKVAGGGFPIGMFGGRGDIMDDLSPHGDVYQAGTFSGNPLSVAGALASLDVLENEDVIETAAERGEYLRARLAEELEGESAHVQGLKSMFSVLLRDGPAVNKGDIDECRFAEYDQLHLELAKRGVYFPPSQYETVFTSAAHTTEELDETADAVSEAYVVTSR